MRIQTTATRSRRMPLLATTAAVALLFAACGDDVDDDAASTESTADATTTTDPGSDGTSDDGTSDDEPADDTTDEGDGAGAEDDSEADDGSMDESAADDGESAAPGSADDPFCQELQAQKDDLTGPDSPLLAVDDPEAYLDAAAELWDALAPVAPPELTDAIATGQASVEEVAADGDPSLQSILALGTDEDYIEAVEALGAYGQSSCGIDVTDLFVG